MVSFTRRGDAWTLTYHPEWSELEAIQVNGATVARGETVPIDDGGRIESERWSYVLVTRDVPRTVRALLA